MRSIHLRCSFIFTARRGHPSARFTLQNSDDDCPGYAEKCQSQSSQDRRDVDASQLKIISKVTVSFFIGHFLSLKIFQNIGQGRELPGFLYERPFDQRIIFISLRRSYPS